MVEDLLFFLIGYVLVQHLFNLDKEPVPIIEVPCGTFYPFSGYVSKETSSIDTACDRYKCILFFPVRQEHGWGIATFDFQWMHINLFVSVINIEENLRRFTNSCNSLEGVAVAYECE